MKSSSAIGLGAITLSMFFGLTAQAAEPKDTVLAPGLMPRHSTPLPQVPPLGAAQPTVARVVPAAGGTWTAVTTAPVSGLCNPLLLTDGTVMLHDCDAPDWWKLTPDSSGNYADGTWSQLASLPVIGGTQYAPQYHASAVLPDGRVIVMGGEYNGSNSEVWTNLGAIYDPVANTWTAVSPPAGTAWTNIGDAQSVVLADGTFLLASCCGYPDADALFDAATLTWTATGAPNAGDSYQDEQGYNLLPNGNVLTIDIWTNYSTTGADPTNAEQYVPASGTWMSAGNTPVSLPDPTVCGNFEIGPAVMRADGTLVAFGGDTGCAGASPTVDPTAIYTAATGVWTAGSNVPSVCGRGAKSPCTLADAPAALLPDGNILFAASAGYAESPTHFFEYTSKNAIEQVADTLFNASSSSSFYYNFLVLPNGQILSTDFSSVPELYTPKGTAKAGWAPVIAAGYPKKLIPGDSYTISGTQLNGLSQGAYYGDDAQASTNYPIVRIRNVSTGKVVYARTANHSTMSIEPGASGSTTFTVPASIGKGASQLVIIANGIASKAVTVLVE